jgi:hypothetical protein
MEDIYQNMFAVISLGETYIRSNCHSVNSFVLTTYTMEKIKQNTLSEMFLAGGGDQTVGVNYTCLMEKTNKTAFS